MQKFKINYLDSRNRVVKSEIIEMHNWWHAKDYALSVFRTTGLKTEIWPAK